MSSTFNNTIITMTDNSGNVISQSSAGAKGFRGSRKSTAFAAQKAGESAAETAVELGMKTVDVYVKGPGAGRSCYKSNSTCRNSSSFYKRCYSYPS